MVSQERVARGRKRRSRPAAPGGNRPQPRLRTPRKLRARRSCLRAARGDVMTVASATPPRATRRPRAPCRRWRALARARPTRRAPLPRIGGDEEHLCRSREDFLDDAAHVVLLGHEHDFTAGPSSFHPGKRGSRARHEGGRGGDRRARPRGRRREARHAHARGHEARPLARATTAVAHAPVPHASVRPTPRSQTTRSMASLPSGPSRARRSSRRECERSSRCCGPSTSIALFRERHRSRIACGFPASATATSRSLLNSRTRSPRNRTMPMSTRTWPRPLGARRNHAAPGPASVAMIEARARSSSAQDAMWSATHRIPLPHISGVDPSALKMRMRGVVLAGRCDHGPAPVRADAVPWRSQSRERCRRRRFRLRRARRRYTTKSLPSPSYFAKRRAIDAGRVADALP